jgi:hypothetical protein
VLRGYGKDGFFIGGVVANIVCFSNRSKTEILIRNFALRLVALLPLSLSPLALSPR